MLNRKYKAKILLGDKSLNQKTGQLGEAIFKYWFGNNFNDEVLHKQKADRDYQGIDFADEKGYTYQVKATRGKSYTFNCVKENINNHVKADFYVFIQIKDKSAYIEDFYSRDYVEKNIVNSYSNGNCFVYAKDLQQQELELNA